MLITIEYLYTVVHVLYVWYVCRYTVGEGPEVDDRTRVRLFLFSVLCDGLSFSQARPFVRSSVGTLFDFSHRYPRAYRRGRRLFFFFLFVCFFCTVPLGLSEVVRRLFFPFLGGFSSGVSIAVCFFYFRRLFLNVPLGLSEVVRRLFFPFLGGFSSGVSIAVCFSASPWD